MISNLKICGHESNFKFEYISHELITAFTVLHQRPIDRKQSVKNSCSPCTAVDLPHYVLSRMDDVSETIFHHGGGRL